MGKPLFTPEELAELAAFDAEIDESDITQNEIDASRERDREAVLAGMSKRNRKIAEAKRAYYEANREKIAEAQRAYYEANREKWNAYMREHRKRRRTHGENQSSKHHHQGAAGCVRGADAPGEDDAQADR